MIVGRVIGWLVLLAGLSVLTRDVMVWIHRKFWAPVGLGQLWYELSGSGLNLVRAEIQRHVLRFCGIRLLSRSCYAGHSQC
jgi:hypothetical protein